MTDPTRRLQVALATNTVFSGACGLALLAGPDRSAGLFGAGPPWLFGALGLGLVLFAAVAAFAAAGAPARRTTITAIVAADVLWVAASPVVMLAGTGTLTGPGQGLIALVALVVALLAAAQWSGLRGALRGAAAGA